MQITAMTVPHAFRITPERLADRRGSFFEAWRHSALSEAVGAPFRIEQVNYSVSKRNTLRGIHGTITPPGQAKLVTCVRGAAMDVVVDLRVDSPTFGCFDSTLQDEESGIGVYLAEGLGHAFLALTEDVCMNYLCSTEYLPGTMVDVDARDQEIGIPWGLSEPPIMSEKDAAAPTIRQAVADGLLPTYQECLELYAANAARTAVG